MVEVCDLMDAFHLTGGYLHCQSVQGQRGCFEERQLQGLEVDRESVEVCDRGIHQAKS